MVMHYLGLLTDTTTGIDVTLIDNVLAVAEDILAMYKIFPLNIVVTGFVIGIVVGVIRKLKRA